MDVGGVPAVHQASLVIGMAILVFTPVGHIVKSYALISEPLFAMAIGVLFGPLCAGWVDPQSWVGDAVARPVELEIARIVIAIQVVNSGTDLSTVWCRKHWRSVLSSITIVMVLMYVISWGLVVAIFPSLSLLQALLVAGCITPTDPVLSSVLVKGRFAERLVPEDVRNLLTAESAANDGLGLPFVFLPMYLMQYSSVGEAMGRWFWEAWVYNVLLSAVIGTLWGAAVALVYNVANFYRTVDKEAQIALLIALAFAVTGGLDAMGSDGILGAFCAGLAFGTLQAEETEGEILERESAIDGLELILTFFFFFFFGTFIPWNNWADIGVGRLIALAAAVTCLRRPPVLPLTKALRCMPVFRTYRETLLAGWLGPIGVAAVFWSALTTETLGAPAEAAYTISTFLVFAHVIVFSLTGPLVSRGYVWFERSKWGERADGIRTVPLKPHHHAYRLPSASEAWAAVRSGGGAAAPPLPGTPPHHEEAKEVGEEAAAAALAAVRAAEANALAAQGSFRWYDAALPEWAIVSGRRPRRPLGVFDPAATIRRRAAAAHLAASLTPLRASSFFSRRSGASAALGTPSRNGSGGASSSRRLSAFAGATTAELPASSVEAAAHSGGEHFRTAPPVELELAPPPLRLDGDAAVDVAAPAAETAPRDAEEVAAVAAAVDTVNRQYNNPACAQQPPTEDAAASADDLV